MSLPYLDFSQGVKQIISLATKVARKPPLADKLSLDRSQSLIFNNLLGAVKSQMMLSEP